MAENPISTRPTRGVWPQQLEYGPEPPRRMAARKNNDLGDAPGSGAITIVNIAQAVQLVSTPIKIRSVTLLAPATNAGTIFVGGKEAAFPLVAGAAAVLQVSDLSSVWVQGTTAADLVFYLAELFIE